MRNRKSGNGLILVALVGLLVVAGVGAWLLVGNDKAETRVSKPSAEHRK